MYERQVTSPRAAMDEAFLLSSQLSDLMDRGVKQLGLTSIRARLLHAVFQLGPQRQRQLSDALGCSAQQVAAVLDVLSDKGLISRQPDPTDRRAFLVSLSQQGDALARDIESYRATAAEWLLKDISDEQLEAFVTVARHIRQQTVVPPSA
ncbi:MarR family winged helix-turn-helix transcriptional regulator [Rhodococcoides yunnanense]|uniref:MarR family winged helix-turn-helix transcriptional regulator n=1 Tax=Rhodococcoides yunnanense TaxID=278209 RepID=UPI0022B11ACB|nr:MarR family transcriptional regulator [Rhodococcus yunnanensis]MCZ4278990.1 MarR family transcriptional regulator [Rhodococcus yunnanensis]